MSTIGQLKKMIEEADAIVIGAGAGLSAAAGFDYGRKEFMKRFAWMNEKYGYTDMYAAGFHDFQEDGERWAYWSEYIYYNRYEEKEAKPLYKKLFSLVRDKNYFVITTNVDHQFQKAGFDKKRLYYMQGDYGLFQCSEPCQQVTFDNEEMIKEMREHIHSHRVSPEFLPHCPYCGAPLRTNLREDDLFVEDEGWHAAEIRYQKFVEGIRHKKVLLLELGVGYSTPVWIKYPFMQFTYENKDATYTVIDKGYISVPPEIKSQTLTFNEDIAKVLDELTKE